LPRGTPGRKFRSHAVINPTPPILDHQTVEAAISVVHISVMDDRLRDREGPRPVEPPSNLPSPTRLPREIGGPKGPEPTRHGDWEFNGRCTDF
jgi:hypothetical protein